MNDPNSSDCAHAVRMLYPCYMLLYCVYTMCILCARYMLLYEVTITSSKPKFSETEELVPDQTARIWQGLQLESRFHFFGKIYFPFISKYMCMSGGGV